MMMNYPEERKAQNIKLQHLMGKDNQWHRYGKGLNAVLLIAVSDGIIIFLAVCVGSCFHLGSDVIWIYPSSCLMHQRDFSHGKTRGVLQKYNTSLSNIHSCCQPYCKLKCLLASQAIKTFHEE